MTINLGQNHSTCGCNYSLKKRHKLTHSEGKSYKPLALLLKDPNSIVPKR